jgi:hypothetical protein
MPGLTTAAVVLLWVMFGFGLIGPLSMILLAVFQRDLLIGMFSALGSELPVLVAVMVVQGILWAIMRGFLAVRIARRSARARTAAFAVESVALAFQVAFAIVLVSAVAAASPGGGFRVNFDLGIALPILVICFLSTTRSRQWCDR